MAKAETCVVCGEVATSFITNIERGSVDQKIVALCEKHSHSNAFDADRLTSCMLDRLAEMKNKTSKVVQTIRCAFIVAGKSEDISLLKRELEINLHFYTEMLERQSSTAKNDYLRCVTAWLAPSQAHDFGQISSNIIRYCELYDCTCTGCGVDITWTTTADPIGLYPLNS